MSTVLPPIHIVLESASVFVKYDKVLSEHSLMGPDSNFLWHVENGKGYKNS